MKTTITSLIILFIAIPLMQAFSQPIIANHQNTHLEEIPLEWIEQAKSEFRIWYGHTSHGSQITSGIGNLQSHIGEPYTYNSSGSGGALSYQETGGDLGHNGSLAWYNNTVSKLNEPGNDRNVVIWSWCGGVSDNTPAGINIYLNAMSQLETDYPDVLFVYMTGHLDIWSWANLKAGNQQIRDYCIANDKILFDFADIESYDPDLTYFEYANDNCNYYDGPGGSYLGNWATEWCAANPGSDLCWSCSCAHSQSLNCNLKGRAFWWMLAEMAGWGQEQTVFYVDNGHAEASDDNPGTEDLPWLTIQHAADVVQAGDSVLVKEGVYYESVSTQNDGNEIDGHIVFAAYPGEDVVIDGTNVGASTGLYLSNAYIKLYDFEITNWPSTGIWAQDASFFEIHGLEVHEIWFGIGISGSSHDFIISETEVHHFTLYGMDASPMDEDYCYNGTFINCTAHTSRDPDQNVDGFALGHGVQNNFLLRGCTTYGVFDGFDISSTTVLLDGCLAYDCANSCYKLWEDDIEMVNCIGYNGGVSIVQVCWQDFPAETTLRNCTFYDAGVYTIWVGNSNDILNMYNCIVSGGENIGLCLQSSAVNYHGDFNLFQNNNPSRTISLGEPEFSTTQIQNGEWVLYSGQDANSVVADLPAEIFSNPAAYNLHLTALSPAVNNGSMLWAPDVDFDGNPRPFGSAPDIGAYESQNLLSYSVDPMNVNFGVVFIGESQTEQITITNNSGTPVIIDNIEAQPEVIELSELSFPIEVEDSFGFDVTFEPGVVQSYSGSINISSSQTYNTEVTLSGTGVNEPSGGYHVSGEVSGVWDIYDTIFVDGDIVVPDGQTLTVNPVSGGTDFIFTGHYRFLVYGQLQLMGTQHDSIHLWSMDSNDGWLGLRFFDLNYNGMDSSRVQFCSFKYGNAYGDGWEDQNGGAIMIYESSNVAIEDCYIHNNETTDGGGGIHLRYCSPNIKRCKILNNSASFGGGVHFWGSYSNLQSCVICQNMALVEGGGLNINGCSPVFDHCTVSENSSPLGDGLYMMDWSYPEFTNSIVWGNNETDIHVLPDGGDILFAYSDVGGEGIFPGTGNINEDPLFRDADNGDFSLTWANYPVIDETKSPCINSGDPAYPLDPDGSVTDMGAITFVATENHFPGGDISGIFDDLNELFIDGNVTVPLGEVLEIHSVAGGTDIIFSGLYSITVYGKLLLIGNQNDSIRFNAENPETGWRGIRFMNTDENGQGNSELCYCDFQNGINTSQDQETGGAILALESSNLEIYDCSFISNEAEKGGAIALINCLPDINHLFVAGNLANDGGGLYIEGSSSKMPLMKQKSKANQNIISNIEFISNWADDYGGGLYITNSSPKICNLTLEGNGASIKGGAMYITGDASPNLYNCLVSDNIAGWGAGLVIRYVTGIPKLYNFTIVNNVATSSGGAMYCAGTNPEIHNSIIWNNSAASAGNQIYLSNSSADPYFSYSDIEGGTDAFGGTGAGVNYDISRYTNNMDVVPEFNNPEWDFQLSNLSPCINAGNSDTLGMLLPETDLDGNQRLMSYVVDMGCYENQEFVAPLQTLTLNAGWNGISSYLIPYFKNPEILFDSIIEDVIILQNYDGVFWPEQSLNTLGDWDYHKGYLIKLDQNVSLTIPGFSNTDKSITLQAGWNLIPVLCLCRMTVEEMSLQLGDNLIFLQEAAGTNIYWPAMNIKTLDDIQPGKSYYLLVEDNAILDFE